MRVAALLLAATTAGPDTDGDGVPDGAEIARGTDPLDDDTDDDGLSDKQEGRRGTNPLDPDTDGDDLDDHEELASWLTDPKSRDTDGGRADDGTEVLIDGTDPLDPTDDLPWPGGGPFRDHPPADASETSDDGVTPPPFGPPDPPPVDDTGAPALDDFGILGGGSGLGCATGVPGTGVAPWLVIVALVQLAWGRRIH